jgi:hypothetical protein
MSGRAGEARLFGDIELPENPVPGQGRNHRFSQRERLACG